MSYFPNFLQEDTELSLSSFFNQDEWFRCSITRLKPHDRVLVVRMSSGARSLVESVIEEYDSRSGCWVNDLGTPIVFPMDSQIYTTEPRQWSESLEDRERVLGG